MKKRLQMIIWLSMSVMVGLFILLFCGFTTKIASADAGNETQVGIVLNSDEANAEMAPAMPAETLWTRIDQWFSHNLAEFLGSVNLGAVAACIVAIIMERRGNKKASKIATESLKTNTDSNSEVIKVVNALVERYNETLDNLHSMESNAERQEHIMSVLGEFTKAILEILTTVYANNKNIPQAVKDLVNIKYVQALKIESKGDEKEG